MFYYLNKHYQIFILPVRCSHVFLFFFQAEDGIRVGHVTGVQTCALPICDLLPGSVRDVSVVISHDGGKSFADPVPFSGDQWQVEGCPHNGPSIVSVKDKFWVTWFTIGDNPGVYLAELDDSGEVILTHLLSSSARFVQTSALRSA